jgi:hypothetical protein
VAFENASRSLKRHALKNDWRNKKRPSLAVFFYGRKFVDAVWVLLVPVSSHMTMR